jgi:hypothetical protein
MNARERFWPRRNEMRLIAISLLTLTFLITTSGCSTTAPNYQGSRKNAESLSNLPNTKIGVSTFTDSNNSDNKKQLSMRGNTVNSPYGESYASYIENAIRTDLILAGRHSNDSDLRIAGVVIKNDVDASGINIGTGISEVEITFSNKSRVVLKKRFSQDHQWESSFVGAVAIPRAMNEYGVLIEKLIHRIFSDGDFIKAIRASETRRQ